MGGNILYEHNRKAYLAAVSMMGQTGKAAVIHPTGTGKSFLAFQLCADNPQKTVCWLSPSEYIFKTQLEKWYLAGGAEIKNIKFMTYAKRMHQKEEELANIQPDYIVLDEFHRCGAMQWGDGVKKLMAKYPLAKVLGLSATSIRYLDNQRDMAWELFGGNIASELTLGAAVAQGILPAPKYVLSVYSYQKELARYKSRIRQTKNRAVRDAAEKEFEALRRALEKADGLTEVFARHMRPKRAGTVEEAGKYIVFCANYDHLLKMQGLAPEWFAKVDAKPHIYTAYSDEPATEREFQAFKEDRGGHLKLLYCIDMLNEGIHIDDVDGVILLRPTVSPTVYKQQIGRALAAGKKKTPIIFDIVLNIENLCSIGVMEEELQEAVLACRADGQGDGIVKEHFQVVDELGDCRKLFAQLNGTLGASWDAMYAIAKEYYDRYGDLKVPAQYTTPDGYSLGAWVATQRKVFLGKTAGVLNENQVERLDRIGMCWQGVRETAWERNFARAKEYFKKHGDLKIPADYVTGDGCRLGRWVRRQREQYLRKGSAGNWQDGESTGSHPGRIERLLQIGMVFEGEDPWEKKFALAKKYYEEHGNLRMAADYVVEGVWLDRWLRGQKAKLAEKKVRTPLTEDQKQKLASIGIRTGASQAELSWREQYREAEEFYRKNGNLSIPKRYTAGNGKNLGIWLQHQREGRRKGKLAGWQIRFLDGIGMTWEFQDAWEVGFSHAKEYVVQYKDLVVPNAYISPDGYRLGKWISNQRSAYRDSAKKKLTGTQVRKLEALGMVWDAGQGRRDSTYNKKNTKLGRVQK